MKSSFENRYRMSKGRYMEWIKRPIPDSRKKRVPSNIIWGAFSAVAIYLAIKNFMDGEYVVAACFLLLVLISVFSVFFMTGFVGMRDFRKLAKFQGAEEWDRVIQFADKITFLDGKTRAQYSYDMFSELVNSGSYLALRLKQGPYMRLYKDSFKNCTPAEFTEFMKQKNPDIRLRDV